MLYQLVQLMLLCITVDPLQVVLVLILKPTLDVIYTLHKWLHKRLVLLMMVQMMVTIVNLEIRLLGVRRQQQLLT